MNNQITYPIEIRTIFPCGSKRDRVREMIRIRDNRTCQICGDVWLKEKKHRRLDVHHIDCDKEKTNQCDDYDTEKDNMITLCHCCHFRLHELQKQSSEIFTIERIRYINSYDLQRRVI